MRILPPPLTSTRTSTPTLQRQAADEFADAMDRAASVVEA